MSLQGPVASQSYENDYTTSFPVHMLPRFSQTLFSRRRPGVIATEQRLEAHEKLDGWVPGWGPQGHFFVRARLALGAQSAANNARFLSYRYLDQTT